MRSLKKLLRASMWTAFAFISSKCVQGRQESLVSMRRPLWTSRMQGLGFSGLVDFAAQKLLRSGTPTNIDSFSAGTLWGVASALSRLGIHPFSSSALASRCVTEFMAVLSYVAESTDQLVCTYASEPVLAFGVARVWYEAAGHHHDDQFILHKYMLPQMTTLMRQEVVDTGSVGVLVARFVLLLVMDTVGTVKHGEAGRCYAGAFNSVWEFLGVLQGDKTTVQDVFGNITATSEADINALKSKWSKWQIGFSHFVQLTKEPDEECLWSMLARRAAGIFPRSFKGADLIIPIFKDSQVSMVLVQVADREDGDPSFPETATVAMRPNAVFDGEKLNSKTSDDVLRVYMSLRGHDTARRFFLQDPRERPSTRGRHRASGKKTEPKPDPVSYVVCVQGLAAWDVQAETGNGSVSVVFLSKEMVSALARLSEPWWRPRILIDANLEKLKDKARNHHGGLAAIC